MTNSDAISLYLLTKEILEAKRLYYTTGKSPYTDFEYDHLEKSFRTLHGNCHDILYMVGYDPEFKLPDEGRLLFEAMITEVGDD